MLVYKVHSIHEQCKAHRIHIPETVQNGQKPRLERVLEHFPGTKLQNKLNFTIFSPWHILYKYIKIKKYYSTLYKIHTFNINTIH